MRFKLPILFLIMAITLSTFANTKQTDTAVSKELPLPELPDSLKNPADRADYILEHFWDQMDFNNKDLYADTVFIEQNFVNYINLFPHAHQEKLETFVNKFSKEIENDKLMAKLIYYLSDKYLDSKDSPMRNGEYHILFLTNAAASEALGEAGKLRAQFRLEAALKNRPNTPASDFSFTNRDGSTQKLSEVKTSDNILLLFYDPDCNHCIDIIDEIKSLNLNSTTIIAIDSEEDKELWDKTKDSLPANWIVGFANDPIQEDELYIFEEMPTLFLLTSDKIIRLKDATIKEISGNIR